ncbi:MAG TPA: hypothetical protein DDY17_06050 [Syntrophaceae bacterium]|jgi:hypothetical protein|nr:hypothetical protein [Syntrophaceae bacterium]
MKALFNCLYSQLLLSVIILMMTMGCTSIPSKVDPDFHKSGTKLIAVLPVNNHTNDAKAAQILREKVFNELYFKGYPKIPLELIDAKLSKVYEGYADYKRENLSPKAVGELLGVDAVLYATLHECSTSFTYVYAPIHVSVVFELRSAKTGGTLWSSRYGTVKRNYGLSREQLEMESYQAYEPAIQEVVDKAMKTLPDFPDPVT